SKCSQSASARFGAKPSASRRRSPSSRCTASELQYGPTARSGHAAQRAIRVDGNGVSDGLEKRKVGVAVGIRRRPGEVVAELANAARLFLCMQGPQRAAGVDAVLDLAERPERAVEAEVVCDSLHDLLESRRDDVDGLAATPVPLDEVERLGVHERTQNALHRV